MATERGRGSETPPRGRTLGPVAAAGAALLLASGFAAAQERPVEGPRRVVTLEEAVRTALEGNPELRIAAAREEIARAEGRASAARLLPRVDGGAGWTRSVDPVFAFGTKLRQGRFTEADFALDALNDPSPVEDWTAGAEARWAALDLGLWAGRSAAEDRAAAAGWERARARRATVFATRVRWFAAAAAEASLEAAEASLEAAGATHELFQRRREEGLLTRADALQAEAELRAAEAGVADAERAVRRARQELALQLGWDPEVEAVPADSLRPPDPGPPVDGFRAARRSDLRALEADRRAAEARARQANYAFLPAVEAFARVESHATGPLESDGTDWTAGVALRWNFFSGFGRFAERDRARAAEVIAETRYEDALRTARAEVDQARRAVSAARRAAAAMRAAAAAAEEGRSLIRRRFEEGLATAADLLQAEARASLMRSRAVEALADYHVSVARLEFVTEGRLEEAGTEGEGIER